MFKKKKKEKWVLHHMTFEKHCPGEWWGSLEDPASLNNHPATWDALRVLLQMGN